MMQTQPQTEHSPSPSSVRLVQIPPDGVWKVAGVVAPILERAVRLSRGRMVLEDVLAAVEKNEMQLWVAAEEGGTIIAAMVTELVRYPQLFTCNVLLLAGRGLARWKDFIVDVEAWARAEGCAVMEIQGRRGWNRIYPEYEFAYEVTQKEL